MGNYTTLVTYCQVSFIFTVRDGTMPLSERFLLETESLLPNQRRQSLPTP